jgi:ankyrin repeat protein
VDLALIHVLLQKGADPNHTISSNGITPLMLAAHKGLNGIVKLLLRKGVDPNQKDILGNVALIYASEKGHSEVIMTLLRAGADLTISNKKGQSFLTYISRFPEAQAFREAYLAESRGELLRNPKILSPDIVGEITKFLFKGKKSKGKKSKKSKRKSVKKTKKSIRRVYK